MNYKKITKYGYEYNKIIFIAFGLTMLGLIYYLMAVNNFDFSTKIHFVCDGPFSCENPLNYMQGDCAQKLTFLGMVTLYESQDCRVGCDWCNKKYLPPGEYGTEPNAKFLYNNIGKIIWLLFGLSFVLNHYLHNRGRKFDAEIVVGGWPFKKTRVLNFTDIWEKVKKSEIGKNE